MATMEAIGVLARVRPESSPHNAGLHLEDDCTVVLLPPDGDTRADKPARAKGFKLDYVFGQNASQDTIYRVAQPLALSVVQGYNATIFAYGHTGSGKTHTMSGLPSDPGERYSR